MDVWAFERTAKLAGFRNIGGIDEAGRGPLAGPVVAACVVLNDDFDTVGITDSKKLSERKRVAAFEKISEYARGIGIGVVNCDIIDKINILQATYMAMRLAVQNLECSVDYLLVDGNPAQGLPIKSMSIVKGDIKSVSISAASIIAKVTRDRIMVELDGKYPQYGFARHKGYGTREHLAALDRFGACSCHRLSFSPVRLRSLQCRLTELN